MNIRQGIGALLASAILLGSIASTEVNAFGPRRAYAAPYYPPIGDYGMYYPMYIAPLPGYGILPPPFTTMTLSGYSYDPQGHAWRRTVEDRSSTLDQSDSPARKRPSLYPAVPFEKTAEERLSDLRRVRYVITVPSPDAIVLIDGVKTTKTGLTRVFVTPPMQEEKEYTVTITVRWTGSDGTPQTREKTFNFLAGDTVPHTFRDY